MDNQIASTMSPQQRLAECLEKDIRRRALRPGDRYFTAAEAGHFLGVSAATAHRSMRLLADRGWLTRSPSRGTFVGPSAETAKAVPMKTVHWLMFPSYGEQFVERFGDLLMAGMRRGLPDASVQFNFLHFGRELDEIDELIRRAGPNTGFLVSSARSDVYQLLIDRDVPMVLLGTPYEGMRSIPHVDLDLRRAGELLTQYLLELNHRRFLLLWPETNYPGDHALLDGISAALSAAGFPHNALVVRSLPTHNAGGSLGLEKLLFGENGPTAVLSRSPDIASRVRHLLAQSDLPEAQQIEVAAINNPARAHGALPGLSVEPEVLADEIVCRAARLLGEVIAGTFQGEPGITIPVRLHHADAEASASQISTLQARLSS